ncbi:hypothetical protein, partial [Faecalibaculum rodentium]|uniref:hypothetical protein n=1 Tax=Faecalibaculum rodentium TaxID=1702221 RepID=UPI0025B760A0
CIQVQAPEQNWHQAQDAGSARGGGGKAESSFSNYLLRWVPMTGSLPGSCRESIGTRPGSWCAWV